MAWSRCALACARFAARAVALRLQRFDLALRRLRAPPARVLTRRLLLVELRCVLLGVLDGAGACLGQVPRSVPPAARAKAERRLRLVDLRLARRDLRLLHGESARRCSRCWLGRRDLRLGLRERDR